MPLDHNLHCKFSQRFVRYSRGRCVREMSLLVPGSARPPAAVLLIHAAMMLGGATPTMLSAALSSESLLSLSESASTS